MPEVIKAGHVYLAKPPLFGLIKGTGNTRKIEYIYNEEALEHTLTKRIEERKAAGTKINPEDERFKQAGYTAQQRFKGLGRVMQSISTASWTRGVFPLSSWSRFSAAS